jgi:hypothetical protein
MANSASVVFASFVFCAKAFGDVGLIMNESTGKGVSGLTSAGHSAVYLSNICPASPIKLRLCKAGEQGSVLSNYTNFGETQPYEWNIIPISVFLYGVEDPSDAPLYGNKAALKLLQEQYRKKHLNSICPSNTCGNPAATAHWRDMVGGTFVREIYLFRVKTTLEQDERLVAEFNALPNANHYNGFRRNCADFARSVVNRYFRDAAKPDHLNDFGMTSPKAISKSFTHYGEARPQLDFTAERFGQLPGQIPRSSPCRKGTEVSFRLKKWFIPLMVLRSRELPFFVAAYSLTGRFDPDREVKHHPAEELVSSQVSWRSYRDEFREIFDTAVADGVFSSGREMKSYFKELDREGQVELDGNGRPVLSIKGRSVGLSRGNLLSPDSDPIMAYQIMLARVQAVLYGPASRREDALNFTEDWDLLMESRDRFGADGN